jgi:hypothetical protein
MSRKSFEAGDTVMTPYGKAEVVYKRMGGPDANEVVAYSVLVESKVEAMDKPPFPSYNGTIVPAKDVTEISTGVDVKKVGPGINCKFPPHALHFSKDEVGVMLTVDEARDLQAKLKSELEK